MHCVTCDLQAISREMLTCEVRSISIGWYKRAKQLRREIDVGGNPAANGGGRGSFEKQSTRDGLRQEIHDLHYHDHTGLPASKYGEDTLSEKTDAIFQHFMHKFDYRTATGAHPNP